MAKKMALGRGIGALLDDQAKKGALAQKIQLDEKLNQKLGDLKEDSKTEVPQGSILTVDVENIVNNEHQPRKIFKEAQLKELAQSIKENGIIQPLVVTPKEGKFELVAGERRLRASKLAGIKQVPVIVKRVTDREKLALAIIENVQRSDLNCVEEALAYYQLMEDFKLTQEEVARRIGKERSSVANFLRILNLPRPIIDLLQKELLSFGHAKLLVGLKDSGQQIALGKEAVKKGFSVRELEKKIKAVLNPKVAPDQQFDETLDSLKNSLEKRTGFHFVLQKKGKEQGQVVIKYTNKGEFNRIYDFLMK